ncbi:hypothetical protein BC938DRAFT_475187, partial [Jimgerdemannia flammicorona]
MLNSEGVNGDLPPLTPMTVEKYTVALRGHLKKIDEAIEKHRFASKNRSKQFREAVQEIIGRLHLGKVEIAVVGDAGADSSFVCDLKYKSKEEWEKELELYFDFLKDECGNIVKSLEDSDQKDSASKLRTVFGLPSDHTTWVFEQLRKDERVNELLGRTNSSMRKKARLFSTTLKQTLKAPDPTRDYTLLIKEVHIRGPFEILRSGAILVDLPGVGTTDAITSAVTCNYLKSAKAFWVVHDILRAADNQNARNQLKESFRRRVFMDNQLRSVAFVCTKTDQCEPDADDVQLDSDQEDDDMSCDENSSTEDNGEYLARIANARNISTVQKIRDNFRAIQQEVLEGKQQPFDDEELHVSCVSSRDYFSLRNKNRKPRRPPTFTDIQDTGIIQLREFIGRQTENRVRIIFNILRQDEQILQTMLNYIAFNRKLGLDSEYRRSLQTAYQESLSEFQASIKALMAQKLDAMNEIFDKFQESLIEPVATAQRESLRNIIQESDKNKLANRWFSNTIWKFLKAFKQLSKETTQVFEDGLKKIGAKIRAEDVPEECLQDLKSQFSKVVIEEVMIFI